MSRAALLAVFVALALPGSAGAQVPFVGLSAVAVGEGAPTTCEITTSVYDYPFSDYWKWTAGAECSVPVEMLSEAWWDYSGGWTIHTVCSGFRALCEESDTDQGELHDKQLRHHVKMRAPFGQGWVRAPENCSGLGTDNLECWLTAG